jgi:hypothetical protein
MAKVVRLAAAGVAVGLVAVVAVKLFFAKPSAPVAVLRVVDAAGQPVPGATIKREGMRTKPGAYRSGWYGWRGVENALVVTDVNGEAEIEYPEYVFEKVETGVVCLAVEHPDFVSQRAERDVDTSLPENAPKRDQLTHLVRRVVKKQLSARPDPIVLKKGGILKITVPPEFRVAADAPLFGQVSKGNYDTSFWIHPGPGMLATRRLAEGTQAVRVAQFDARGAGWFSEVTNVVSEAGKTVELTLHLKRGAAVRGKLDETVPRPVMNGRVIVNILPTGLTGESGAPHWHSWTAVRADGSFEFASLPSGDLEIAAICQGFISTNGAGKFRTHYPQDHALGTNDLETVIGMEATARLEALVVDQKEQPVVNAKVSAWPNLRWGEWSSVILGTDLYDVGEWMRGVSKPRDPRKDFHDFDGTTDARGVAVLPNLPLSVRNMDVSHTDFQIPAKKGADRDVRSASVALRANVTNHVKIVVEPIAKGMELRHR